jgi:hypothetical protein
MKTEAGKVTRGKIGSKRTLKILHHVLKFHLLWVGMHIPTTIIKKTIPITIHAQPHALHLQPATVEPRQTVNRLRTLLQ